MKPFVDTAFWSEPDIEAAGPEVKLGALWIMTNSQTTALGICRVSPARFRFETGLKEDDFSRTISTLARHFAFVDNTIFVRNFVRTQWGTGEKLVKSNMFPRLCSEFDSIQNSDLRDEIFRVLPELGRGSEGASKPLISPKEGKGKEGKGEGSKGSAEGREGRIAWSLEAGWQGVTERIREVWGKAYPACDIDTELFKMTAWLTANPKKAPRSNYARFATQWLDKSQNSGGTVKNPKQTLSYSQMRPQGNGFSAPAVSPQRTTPSDPENWRVFLQTFSEPYVPHFRASSGQKQNFQEWLRDPHAFDRYLQPKTNVQEAPELELLPPFKASA